jgi:hypothetical protein
MLPESWLPNKYNHLQDTRGFHSSAELESLRNYGPRKCTALTATGSETPATQRHCPSAAGRQYNHDRQLKQGHHMAYDFRTRVLQTF